jgi:hypothetical protein
MAKASGWVLELEMLDWLEQGGTGFSDLQPLLLSLNAPLQASTLLSDGRVFTIGGSWNGGIFIKNAEIWSEAAGWTLLPGCPVGLYPELCPISCPPLRNGHRRKCAASALRSFRVHLISW